MSRSGRVLVTGGTGAFGTATTRWLLRQGHEVVVMARREPARLPTGATFAQADIQDADAVRRAMRDCDVVAHFAWTLSGAVTHEQAAPLDLGGTRNVLDAMADTGCTRLVFASSVTAYGAHPDHPQPWREEERLAPAPGLVYEWHKAQAEDMIVESGVEALRVRPTAVVGRSTWNGPAAMWRQLVVPDIGGDRGMQLVHQEDVGRFFALACGSSLTGAVNLAATDVLTWREMAELAGHHRLPLPKLPTKALVKALSKVLPVARSAPELLDIMLLNWPVADTTRLRNEFGFEPGYSSREALADQGNNGTAYISLAMKRIRKPLRLDLADRPVAAAGDDDGNSVAGIDAAVAGEFDTIDTDPRYPEWTCANLAEAFPGPMTPLSLHLTADVLFTSADIVAKVLPLDERIRDNIRRRQLGIFGHRLYHNVTVLREMVVAVPGQTAEEFDHQINGQPLPDGWRKPAFSIRDVGGLVHFGIAAGPRLAGLGAEVSRVKTRAAELTRATAGVQSMSDARLLAHLGVLWDATITAWQVGNLCTFLVSTPTARIEQKHGLAGVAALRAGAERLPSARLLHGIRHLSSVARSDEVAEKLLRAGVHQGTFLQLTEEAPAFGRAVQSLLDEVGHRGPGETELANRVYADDPDLLLRAVAGALDAKATPDAPPQPKDLSSRVLASVALAAMSRRENCRDAVTLLTHQLRLTVRERGRRLAQTEVIADADDVFYLTPDELLSSATHLTDAVTRRRAERERLAALDFPLRFEGTVDLDAKREAVAGTLTLSGTGASPGVARGRVRHLRTPDDELEPGEVLLASATDTGWTPFFAMAAAVITDIGGLMSHASIVAREFGVPAVVGADGACSLLADGQLVEVDGSAGTVTLLEG